MRMYFMRTERIGFSRWAKEDLPLAQLLWGDPEVTRFICASGRFSAQEIQARLETEICNDTLWGIQYWPVFVLDSGELIGCCGLRPCEEPHVYEIGFHLRKNFWGKGFAGEAASKVIEYAFASLDAKELRAGHHPHNSASKKLLHKLGFEYLQDCYYAPTGLMHPSYRLCK
jgi:ribosomal-protein-alanine N-acetyltransferase